MMNLTSGQGYRDLIGMKPQAVGMVAPPLELGCHTRCVILRIQRLQEQVADILTVEALADGQLAGLLGLLELAPVQLCARQILVPGRIEVTALPEVPSQNPQR